MLGVEYTICLKRTIVLSPEAKFLDAANITLEATLN